MYSPKAGCCPGSASETTSMDQEKTRRKKSRSVCSESEALQLLCQFDELYKCRIAEVECDKTVSEARRNELKLKIMNDWVKDLGEQNTMLVQTVHDLEKAAVCRVKLLADKLQETSINISHSMLNSDKSEDDLKELSGRVHNLVEKQLSLECTIKNLNCDIDSLLELIKRGRLENNWSLEGLTFCEIDPSEIPEPSDCTCNQQTCETRDNLSEAIALKHDEILALKCRKSELKKQLCASETEIKFKDEIIEELRKELKQAKQAPRPVKKVRVVNYESCEKLELKSAEDRLQETTKQLEDLRHLLDSKNDEISKLKKIVRKQANQLAEKTDQRACNDSSVKNQNEVLTYLLNLAATMEKDNEKILSLKLEYETVLKNLLQTKNEYENNVAIVNEKLLDIEIYLRNYRHDVLEQVSSTDNTKEFISSLENKITSIKNMFQNKCEMCVKENLLMGIAEIISKVMSGIQVLSEIHEKESKTTASIKSIVAKSNFTCDKNSINEKEQKAIFEAIMQQFRMMEEFRICTVEVQAATEDLQEEVTAVVSNLKMQHCRYIELTKMVGQVQDYFVKTKESITEVINRLELQDQERARNSQRLTNNRIRLKDIKNEFNQSQSALSKCLNNVHKNIQHTTTLGYTEIHTCNDLLISVIEEVEQITSNLQTVKTQDCCTLSTIKELNKQMITIERNIKELKKKIDSVLSENEIAQKKFAEKSKRLEKYEAEVDNSHTKMQDVLESIIAIRDQMNEFGCVQESKSCFESTNDIVEMKNDLRRLKKECEALKIQVIQEKHTDVQNKTVSEVESRNIDLQDKIKILQNELKCKQEANVFLQKNIESLEKELDSTRVKAEDCRKCASFECLNLKKKIFELENSLKVQKDTDNNVKCSEKNEIDSKKLQLLDYANVPQLLIVLQDTIHSIKSGLLELSDNLKRLAPEGSTRTSYSKDSIWTAIELLKKYVESIKICSYEVEKIKSILYSKDKLMENMNEIIKIQKDSIQISESEVEDLHKKLQEKIEAQEKIISQCDKEKRQLNQQIELQVQTIGHLQAAVVEAKKTIDQLNNKATSDNYIASRKIRSLNLYLTEVESQYNDCFGEASKQDVLLELQRDTIAKLKKEIKFLECDEFLNAFMLHFIYYVVLYKYKDDAKNQLIRVNDLRAEINKLTNANNCYEQKCKRLQYKYEEVNKQLEQMRFNLEDSQKYSISKQCEIDELLAENSDLKNRLESYKIDFDLIEEEMKKMGIVDPSIESFKIELEAMRSENEQLRRDSDRYEKTVKDLRLTNKCLQKKLSDCKTSRDANLERLQKDLNVKNEKIKILNNQITYNKKEINDQSQLIEDLKNKLLCAEHRLSTYCTDLNSAKERIKLREGHIDKLQRILEEKTYRMEKLIDDNKYLKNNAEILKAEACMANEKLRNQTCILEHQLGKAQSQLIETQKNYEVLLQDLNSKNKCLYSIGIKRCALLNYQLASGESGSHDPTTLQRDHKYEETVERLTKDLEESREKLEAKNEAFNEIQSKLSAVTAKYESAERNCTRQKDELMLMEKKLTCINQKFQNCTDKNDELIRQNKLLEENYNKCMAELEDIMLQLEDMQSSLVELRNECEEKTKSLDNVSVELDKMRVSRSEVCEESQYVLQWVRLWMTKQKQTTSMLQDRLDEKHQQLLRLGTDKRNFTITIKRLKRRNKILTKRLKLIRKPVLKPACIITNGYPEISESIKKFIEQRCGSLNGFNSYDKNEPNAEYSVFRKAGKQKSSPIDIVTTRGDSEWFSNLDHLSKQLPKLPQISEKNRAERKISEETTDYGYQTSSSK